MVPWPCSQGFLFEFNYVHGKIYERPAEIIEVVISGRDRWKDARDGIRK